MKLRLLSFLVLAGLIVSFIGPNTVLAQEPQPPHPSKPATVPTPPLAPTFEYNTLYAVTASDLWRIDAYTGTFSYVGPTGYETTDIAFDGSTLYGVSFSQLLLIDPTTGAGSLIGYIGFNDVNALAIGPDGTMYAGTVSGALLKVDKSTGIGTLIGYYGLGLGSSGDLAINANNKMYASVVVSGYGTDWLAQIDENTGSATLIGDIGETGVLGIDFKDGNLYGVTTNGYLLKIDTTTGQGTIIATTSADFWGLSTSGPAPSSQKPPLVIVHGWLGAPGSTDSDQCAYGIQHYDGTNSTMGDLPSWFTGQYDVWIAHIDTSSTYTPTIQHNAWCLVNELTSLNSVQPITIIAHSMGGLVSRAAIQDLPSSVKIKALYTLGSPHAGVPVEELSSIALLDCVIQPVVCQFSDTYMNTVFNSQYPNQATISYNFIGGDATPLGPGWLEFPYAGYNDGIVGKYSAVGWTWPYKALMPSNWTNNSTPGQYWTNEVHIDDWDVGGKDNCSSTVSSYYSCASDTNPYSHAYECISALMTGNVPDSKYCNDAKTTNTPVHSPSTPTSSLSAFTPLQSGYLDAGQSISIPLAIDTTSSSLFYLTWSGPAPTFTLTRPDSQVIDPTYATTNPSEVTYDSFAGGSEVPVYADYSFPTTQPGTWQLNITASGLGAVDYQAFAALDSSRTLKAQTNADSYSIGDTATISANLQSSGVGLAGATVTANITRPDSVVDVVPLTDQGNGSYSNTYIIPNVPGFLGIDVTATGNDNGTAFTRQEHLIASIKSNAVQLTGTYSDQPIDNNGDGLYEKLNFTAGANLTMGGEYEVSADLYSGTQFVAHSGSPFYLNTGTQTITLPFDGIAIREAGLNGPYIVKNLFLTPIDTGIPSQSVDSAWVTPPYSYTQFGVNAFSDVPNTYWAQTWIQRLYNAGITGGCSTNPLNYCPDNNVTRDQMAVFLERGIHTSSFNPPTVLLTFNDTSGNFAQYWIEALKADGITSGCGGNLYCPSDPTTRAQMAVFLLKSEHGAGYTPPPATGTKFADVPASYWAASWIEQLANEGITSGCGTNLYCPDQSVTRAQMAVFLVKTFNLP